MRYIDTGGRNPHHALGHWLQQTLGDDVQDFRCQSGFFSANGLGPFAGTLSSLAKQNRLTHILVGSNDGETQTSHVLALVELMGIPRDNAKLGVVSFRGGFFHPKTYHVTRTDGSQAAYVGSANLGLPGVGGVHIEAGMVLDTREGDSGALLGEIATAVDAWFHERRTGLEVIKDVEGVKILELAGILAAAPPARPRSEVAPAEGGAADRPRLTALIQLRPFGRPVRDASEPEVRANLEPAEQGRAFTVIEPPYPAYVLFAPGRPDTTAGLDGLSQHRLPEPHLGIILRLNRDASRHFRGEIGTANISLPVSIAHTLRFGFYRRRTERPRAEFELHMRVAGDDWQTLAPVDETNVMVYGFSPGDTGHGNVRMVIPRAPAAALAADVDDIGVPVPNAGDLAALEWPTQENPTFRISFLARGSELAGRAEALFEAAERSDTLVASNATWLPPGLLPEWPV